MRRCPSLYLHITRASEHNKPVNNYSIVYHTRCHRPAITPTNAPAPSKLIWPIKTSSAVRPSGAAGGGGGSGRTSTTNSRSTEPDANVFGVIRACNVPAALFGAATVAAPFSDVQT